MRYLSLAVVLLASPVVAADRPDMVAADFEGDTYGDWTTTGTAFGKGPAKGALPGQMPVTGFLGKGLVNSFNGGDKATGTLTSPAFKIERKYLNFLVGGGKNADKLRVNLRIGGRIRHTATGPNDKPGGTEHLDWHTWDVSAFADEMATIEIIDNETGGWGHINADHFVQSDTRKQAEPVRREFAIDAQYLHFPVKNGAPQRRVKLLVGKDTAREFDIELDTTGKPDFWVFADVSAFKGKSLVVETTLPADSKALAALKTAADVPDAEKLYREKHRPLFHFTSRVGWLNDPNGLVFHNGEWHLFYQHNPFGREWGNMHWGHAVSADLVRWKELGIGLYPKTHGDWAFSGSAVVDKDNTSGWGTKEKPPLVLAYTSTGRGECIAYSTDDGRTWTEYAQNPVVKHVGRDPKLLWHAGAKHWVMAVYTEADKKQWIAFHTSPDLKTWTFASRIEGFFECPDLFQIIDKRVGAKWVLYAADGKYLFGEFDGKEFKSDFKDKKQLWHGRFYAAQTFDVRLDPKDFPPRMAPPLGPRRVQIGWGQGVTFPGTAFNQQMTVPVELNLSPSPDGPRLTAYPVSELSQLHELEPAFVVRGQKDTLAVSEAKTLATDLDAFDVNLTVSLDKATGFTLDLRGTKLVYDAAKQTLTCKDVTAPVHPRDGILPLRVLVDRGSVEVFADSGKVAMSIAAIPDEKNRSLILAPSGGGVTIIGGNVYRMKSSWEK